MELNIEKIARVCHEANRVYSDSIGEPLQSSWEESGEWLRTATMNGVKKVIDNPELTAPAIQAEWLKEKMDAGWKLGPVKDAVKKEHPCIMSFYELPAEIRVKDYLLIGIIKAFVDAAQEK